MPNDAKCGLVIGVGLVIAVAILFFQKDRPSQPAIAIEPEARTSQPEVEAPGATPAPQASQRGAVDARTQVYTPETEAGSAAPATPAIRAQKPGQN